MQAYELYADQLLFLYLLVRSKMKRNSGYGLTSAARRKTIRKIWPAFRHRFWAEEGTGERVRSDRVMGKRREREQTADEETGEGGRVEGRDRREKWRRARRKRDTV